MNLLDTLKLRPTAANILFFQRGSRFLAFVGIALLAWGYLTHWTTPPIVTLIGIWAAIGFFFALVIRLILVALKSTSGTATANTARRR